jgi:hypothetical protein
MKQASFKIDVEKVDSLSIVSTKKDLKNITSKKPIKLVENIYYFTAPSTNSGNM